MAKERSWSSALFEAFVIVSSILLAFGIDAAWDGVQARRAEDELVASVLDEIRQNRVTLESVEETNDAQIASVDAFFRATPDHLLLIPGDSARAVLRGLIGLSAFVPLNEASLALTRSPSTTSEGVEVLAQHAATGRSAGLTFLPSMVMRSDPEALVRVWSDEALATALIAKGTAQTVYGLVIERALPMLDSLEAALSSSLTR